MRTNPELLLFWDKNCHSESHYGILSTPYYFEPKMTTDEANQFSWSAFKEKLNPVTTITNPAIDLEFAVTPKNIAWSTHDVNVYTGSERKYVEEITDLSQQEGSLFFKLNFLLARELVSNDLPKIHVSLGFNPRDFSSGHHSIRRLHTHLYAAQGKLLEKYLESAEYGTLDWFQRLTFIEPFAVLYHDFILAQINKWGFQDLISDLKPEFNSGYTSMHLKPNISSADIFAFISTIYETMKIEYNEIASVFTDGTIDDKTGKFTPRSRSEREARLDLYLATKSEVFSERSTTLLKYLAKNLKEAKSRREKRGITSAETAWITTGFAGAMTFSFQKDKDEIRFDFLPRVITTSAVSKTIFGRKRPTLIFKTKRKPQPEDVRAMQSYHGRILEILLEESEWPFTGQEYHD